MTTLEEQRRFWTEWNIAKQARPLSAVSLRQKEETIAWLASLGRTDLNILEVGCGNGWMTPWLKPLGTLTAVDLSEEVVADAAQRIPGVQFVGGDFMEIDFPEESFDAVVTLEVLAHVADQPAFINRVAQVLRPGGFLVLATQNGPVLERLNRVDPPQGQLRRWVDRHQLRSLLTEHFDILALSSMTPRANRGIWRFLNAQAVNAPIRAVVGDLVERAKERAWLGWTLMAFARKRVRR